jgi:hypothetical protein
MKRYLLFEIKRICRVLPFVLLAAVVLFGSLAAIYSGVLAGEKDSQERNPFLVALVGTGEDTILQMGISALDSMDSSRFALQVVQMEEPEARSALEQGVLSAYVVFPEDFMENAMRGTILPLRFVSPAGASNIVSILRIELTRVITDILDAAQKGTYGSVSVLQELTDVKNPWPFAQGLALAYTQFILLRGDVYEAQSLGLSDGLGLEGHMLCGMIVLFLLLCTMPFSAVMIRKDRSLNRLLAAKGLGSMAQVLCEQAVLFAGFLAVIGSVLAAVFSIGGKFLAVDTSGLGIIALLPVIFTITAISFFLYEISSDLISGILLQFFLYVFLCFVSGCFYPGYFFPETMQHIGNFLPTGLSRMHIAGSITGQDVFNTGLALALWGAGFILLSVIVRSKKLKRMEVGI